MDKSVTCKEKSNKIRTASKENEQITSQKENRIMNNKTMTDKTTTSKTIEAIKNSHQPSAKELFELVNAYGITMLSIQDINHKTITEMDVNYFDSNKTEFEFGQLNTDTKCIINQSDILSTESNWIEDEDMIHIRCCLPDDKKLNLVIFHASSGQKLTASQEYYEIGLYELNEFLQKATGDKAEYRCSMVKIKNNFGLNMRMTYPKKISVCMEDDDTNRELNIDDGVNYTKIAVMDDGCNQFYQKDNESSAEIVIMPYSEPFMEIRMFFEKLS